METVVTPHFYYNADASRQKDENFCAIMDCVFIGSLDITAGSSYLWAEVGRSARIMDCE